MSATCNFTLGNDYRNSAFQQSSRLTLPGALSALSDMHDCVQGAYIDYDDQSRRPPEAAVEQAKRLKGEAEKARDIVAAVTKYTSPMPDAEPVVEAVLKLHKVVQDLYKVGRERAVKILAVEAGI